MLMAHEFRSLWEILVSALVKVMLQAAGFLLTPVPSRCIAIPYSPKRPWPWGRPKKDVLSPVTGGKGRIIRRPGIGWAPQSSFETLRFGGTDSPRGTIQWAEELPLGAYSNLGETARTWLATELCSLWFHLWQSCFLGSLPWSCYIWKHSLVQPLLKPLPSCWNSSLAIGSCPTSIVSNSGLSIAWSG